MWDLAIVGAGPAGSAAALGALTAAPDMSVVLLDRSAFPRDKTCGDGIAPHVLDVLENVGVHGLLDDWPAVSELQLRRGDALVARRMRRPAWVVPRAIFDERLVALAVAAGASLRRHHVRTVDVRPDMVVLDGELAARVVVAADGAHSVGRTATGLPPASRRALALRGYAPTLPTRARKQMLVFGQARQPSYAWSFDRGDGLSNVGYGEMLHTGLSTPSRGTMLAQLEELLPGATEGGKAWRGHHLPLSSWVWRQPDGRVLLAGDAANLVNPLTGEGIYYAVATGVLAGRCAARVTRAGRGERGGSPAPGESPGTLHRRAVRRLLARHLRSTALASQMVTRPTLLDAGLAASDRSQGVFDDLVELGLGRGRITPRLVGGLAGSLAAARAHAQPGEG